MKNSLLRKAFFWIVLIILFSTSVFFLTKKGILKLDFITRKEVGLANIVKSFPFTNDTSLKEWKEKTLKGKVAYEIETLEDLSYVRADSDKAASALYYKVSLDVKRKPVISWKWRVDEFPKRKEPERIENKREEDFAARVYVIFPAAFFTNSKVVEYIWAETLPVGTIGASGYSKNIMHLVLESGKSEDWHFEKRDIRADYIKLFGEEPRLNIGAIAFMTDADSTKTRASAVYDEIQVGYE